jgi:hypothetical protein
MKLLAQLKHFQMPLYGQRYHFTNMANVATGQRCRFMVKDTTLQIWPTLPPSKDAALWSKIPLYKYGQRCHRPKMPLYGQRYHSITAASHWSASLLAIAARYEVGPASTMKAVTKFAELEPDASAPDRLPPDLVRLVLLGAVSTRSDFNSLTMRGRGGGAVSASG